MTNNWNEGRCMAATKNGRCNKKTVRDADFCTIHKNKQNYNQELLYFLCKKDTMQFHVDKKALAEDKNYILIENNINNIAAKINEWALKMDEKYIHSLLDISDSWTDVPLYRRICIQDEWWDLETILSHYSEQLNHSLMENPYPIYPSSPFTRILVRPDQVVYIKKRVKNANISVNIALKYFLNLDYHSIKKCYTESLEKSNKSPPSLLRFLNEKLRYMLTNSINSQNSFVGHWISRHEKKTDFEELYQDWLATPYQLISPMNYDIIENPQKDFLYTALISIETSEWGQHNDHTKEKL
jgi:hypothetical protein